MKIYIITLSFISVIISCGKTKEDNKKIEKIINEKHIHDSTKKKEKNDLLNMDSNDSIARKGLMNDLKNFK